VKDLVQGGLGGAARQRIAAGGIQPVLDDVEVEGAHRRAAEIVQPLIDGVELEALKGLDDPGGEFVVARQGPAIELGQLPAGQAVPIGIEIGEIAEHVADRVADLAIGVGDLAQDLIRDLDVVAVILAGDPEAEDLAPNFSMTSPGATTLPTDLDIFRPWPSTT